jgi:PleD family two-component response regulator
MVCTDPDRSRKRSLSARIIAAFGSTVSVGVAISDDERPDLNALLSAADQALYRAKALCRNRVEPSPYWVERATTECAIAV